MALFPSPVERSVAAILLLLSTEPPSLSPPKSVFEGSEEESQSLSLVSSGASKSKLKSKSSSSSCSIVTSDVLSQEIRAHKLRIIAVVARCHEMKLKVVKKSRSKMCWISDHRKISAVKPEASSGSVSTEASSCLSSARSRYEKPRTKKHVGSNGSGYGSAHLMRRAEAILKFLSSGCCSEVKIREAVGNSPDTSKALRMLLKLEEVKRSGIGGRHDPYIYTIARGN